MAAQIDPESLQRSTEQTPLLAEQPQDSARDEADNEAEPEPTPKRPKSWYAWRIFWAVLAIVILAVFIKGWVDSDSKEVNYCCLKFTREEFTNAFSLISKKPSRGHLGVVSAAQQLWCCKCCFSW
jgi:hypothetical protein